MSAGATRRARELLSRSWPHAALAAWCLAGAVLGALLLGRHLLPFRVEAPGDRYAAVAALQPREKAPAPWTAIHVLYAACRCSQRVLAHISEGDRPPGFVDVVLWAGEPTPALEEAQRRGADVVITDTRELARRYHVEAAPLLVVVDPAGSVRYAGGYGTSKQSAAFGDKAVMMALQADQPAPALPLYGCAASDRLRSALVLLR